MFPILLLMTQQKVAIFVNRKKLQTTITHEKATNMLRGIVTREKMCATNESDVLFLQ